MFDLGVVAQRQQQRMFTGTGSDHQDAHNTSHYRGSPAAFAIASAAVSPAVP